MVIRKRGNIYQLARFDPLRAVLIQLGLYSTRRRALRALAARLRSNQQ